MGAVLSSVKYTTDGTPYYTLNDIKKLDKLDEGGFGTVMKGYDTVVKGLTRKKRAVAVKIFSKLDTYSEGEIEVLKKHSHRNIVELYGVIWNGKTDHYTGYVMEYMELGSLHNEIHDPSKIYDLKMIVKWIHQIAEGLQYLHNNQIIHRDVKPKNILLAARDHLKLADFGLARIIVSGNSCTPGCLQKNVSDRPTICEIRRFAHTYLHTILIIGGFASDLNVQAVILSEDQTRWIKLQLEPLIALKSPDGGIVYLNDEIYIFGGMRYPKALYKLDKNLKWVRLADMNFGRLWITNSCLEWNGYIWVFGEKGEKLNSLQSVERYDPNNNKWTIMPDMIHPRAVAAAALWNGGIVISGGSTDHGQNNSVEYFNPEDGFWKELPNLPTSLDSHSLVSYKEKLIIMGGRDEETSGKVWELDLVNSQWKPLPSMNYPSKNFAGIAFDQEIYAIGGYDKNYDKMNRVEIFDGANWRDGPRLPCEWSKMSAMTIPWDLADRLCNTYKLE